MSLREIGLSSGSTGAEYDVDDCLVRVEEALLLHPAGINELAHLNHDTRCYFNVQSKADRSQPKLPHGTIN